MSSAMTILPAFRIYSCSRLSGGNGFVRNEDSQRPACVARGFTVIHVLKRDRFEENGRLRTGS